jgi:AraC-like DNA-binding protein/tetratricopeptide (TPR) repeat protein
MKWFFFFAILISFSAFSQSQPNQVDTLSIKSLLDASKNNQWINSDRALIYADKALVLAQSTNDRKSLAIAHNLKGFCFWTFGDNELGIQSALEALTIAQNENYILAEAESHYILARCYMDLRENSKAHESIVEAERLARHQGNWELICSIHNLKGVIFFIDHKMDSALHYYNLAYETGKAHAVDPINFPRIIANIGECYSEENPALAFTYFNTALALAKETGNKIAEASITGIVGQTYLRAKDLKKAEANLQSALQLARTLGLRRVIRQCYGGLVEIKLQQERGSEAVVYLQQFYAVRDSLLNTSKVRQVVELEAKHELQLKEQSIKLLESEKRIQAIWTNLLIGAVAALILLSIVGYKIQQERHRKNRKMLDLEIDFLTQQHRETVDRYKALVAPGEGAEMESYDQILLKKAIDIVESKIADPELSVESMATDMNMSRTSLHRKIKSITGFPPSELIRSIRLRTAAKLIANRVDTATQIALRVGFDDYSHFSKAFKKHFGVSPSSYEEQSKAFGQEVAP